MTADIELKPAQVEGSGVAPVQCAGGCKMKEKK